MLFRPVSDTGVPFPPAQQRCLVPLDRFMRLQTSFALAIPAPAGTDQPFGAAIVLDAGAGEDVLTDLSAHLLARPRARGNPDRHRRSRPDDRTRQAGSRGARLARVLVYPDRVTEGLFTSAAPTDNGTIRHRLAWR